MTRPCSFFAWSTSVAFDVGDDACTLAAGAAPPPVEQAASAAASATANPPRAALPDLRICGTSCRYSNLAIASMVAPRSRPRVRTVLRQPGLGSAAAATGRVPGSNQPIFAVTYLL